MLHNVLGELLNSICIQLVGHKPWENWERLFYCLQGPTIHHKDLHINVPVQLHIPDPVYYNEIQLNYLIKKRNSILLIENITIAQTFSMY